MRCHMETSVIGMTSTPLSALLRTLTQWFERNGIASAILRNYEKLPEDNPSGDIDIMVTRINLPPLLELLNSMDGVLVTSVVQRSYATHLYMSGVSYGTRNSLHIDLITSLGWKGLEYLSAAEVCERSLPLSEERAWLRKVDPVDEAIAMFAQSIIVAGRSNKRYEERISETFKSFGDIALKRLTHAFGEAASREMVRQASGGQWHDLEGTTKERRRALVLQSFRAPFRAAVNTLRYAFREIAVRVHPHREFWVWWGIEQNAVDVDAVKAHLIDLAGEVRIDRPVPSLVSFRRRIAMSKVSRLRVTLAGEIEPNSGPDLLMSAEQSPQEIIPVKMAERVCRRLQKD